MFAVSDSEHGDEAYVYFKEGHGLNKIKHRNADIPMLYVVRNDEHFAIADMDGNVKVISLGFETKTIGQYTLNIKANGDFSYLHLIDRMTGEDVDMLVEDDYTFIGAPTDNSERFFVKLNHVGADVDDDIFAYQNGNEIVVEGRGELQVFDIMGRMVMNAHINEIETMYTSSLQSGVYIFRLLGEEAKTQKVMIK